MFRRAMPLRPRTPRCGAKLAMVAALAVVPATLPVLTARAEVAESYPGGCIVAFHSTPPSSCTYVSIAGAPVHVTFGGTGTVSLSGCTSGDLPASPPGRYLTGSQQAGCTYTVTITGTGIADAVDTEDADDAECSDFSDGLILGDFSDCVYSAIRTSGGAIGVAISAAPAEIDITVHDLSAGGGAVALCTVTGSHTFDVSCPYAETLGHQYEVTANDPTFNDVLLAVVGHG